MAQTAIDLLFEQFDVLNSDSSIPVSVVLTPKDWAKLYIKFKSIEKNQIIKSFDAGERESQSMWYENGEQYYKEIYNK